MAGLLGPALLQRSRSCCWSGTGAGQIQPLLHGCHGGESPRSGCVALRPQRAGLLLPLLLPLLALARALRRRLSAGQLRPERQTEGPGQQKLRRLA